MTGHIAVVLARKSGKLKHLFERGEGRGGEKPDRLLSVCVCVYVCACACLCVHVFVHARARNTIV